MFGSTSTGVRRLLLGLGAALAAVLLIPSAASAADETIGLDVPAGAVTVWVDVEQAGLMPADVVVVVTAAGSPSATLTLTRTTFGVHGEVPAAAGRLSLTVAAPAGATSSAPDVALTAVDAQGAVVGAAGTRVRLVAGAPAQLEPVDAGSETAAGGGSGAGALPVTGGGIAGLGLALALLGVGGGVLLWRRLSRRHVPVTTDGGRR